MKDKFLSAENLLILTADFFRLRFGVGKPADGNIADYVLGSFTPDEKIILSQIFVQAVNLFAKVLTCKDANTLIPEWGKRKLLASNGK